MGGAGHLARITLGDHETDVVCWGDEGPPVVLVHALGVDHRMWEPVAGRLAATRRVYAYDVRGHGGAAAAAPAALMTDYGADLIGVLDALGLARAHLGGLSLGGSIAQVAAVAAPGRVASLTLMASTDAPYTEVFEARAKAAEEDGMEAQVGPTLTRWFTPEGLAANSWGVRYARDHVRRADPARWAATWRTYQTLDVRNRLTELPAPTLVVAGERDVSLPVDAASAIAARIPGAGFTILPAAPHMQTLETPQALVDVLDGFLPAR